MGFGWFGKKAGAAAGGTSSSAKGVPISSLLTPALIVTEPEGTTKDAFIETLVGRLCEVRSLGEPEAFLKRVLEREQGISTTLDTGLAVPHARMDGLDDIAAALGLAPKGIEDPKQPDFTIRAMFVFFSPNKQEHFTQHLQLLRSVSSLFQADLLDSALKQSEGAEVLKLIAKREQAA
jgi:mannitol/fructose-specific phosphotransferase system IIA component (Ntr-type)